MATFVHTAQGSFNINYIARFSMGQDDSGRPGLVLIVVMGQASDRILIEGDEGQRAYEILLQFSAERELGKTQTLDAQSLLKAA